MAASLPELKKRLEKLETRFNRLGRAIDKLGNVKDWAQEKKLDGLAKFLAKRIQGLRDQKSDLNDRIEHLKKRIQNWNPPVPPVVDGGWHPDATRNQVQAGIGSYMNVGKKLLWHTTEGSSLPAYSGSHPHFTLNPQTGALYQHISIRSGCMALRNLAGGVETNRANVVQVELIGFASQTQNWSDAAYANIAKLARWIEKHHGVPRRCTVRFGGAGNLPPRLSGQAWYDYAGHLGHQHAPEADHWDPGDLQIGKII